MAGASSISVMTGIMPQTGCKIQRGSGLPALLNESTLLFPGIRVELLKYCTEGLSTPGELGYLDANLREEYHLTMLMGSSFIS